VAISIFRLAASQHKPVFWGLQDRGTKMTKWRRRLACIAFVSPAFILAVCYITLNAVSSSWVDRLTFWAQFLTSNWPNWRDGYISRDSFWYSFGIAFRAALAYAPIAAMVGLFWKLSRFEENQRMMNLYEALKGRDRAIERELLNQLPPERRASFIKPIEDAIRTAAEVWERDFLPSMVGPDKAQSVIDLLKSKEI